MQITLNGIEVYYKRHLGHRQVILLHGWGGSSDSMQPIYEFLSGCGCDVISLDLPAFGKSATPKADFTIFDYAQCVKELIQKLSLDNVTLIGHSFGGRIAILLGGDSSIKSIVLTASAGIKPRFSLKKAIRIYQYKRAVRHNKDTSRFGSADYKALGGDMRKVFTQIVNTHLDDYVKKITVPTLLIWGNNDNQTPLYMAKKIKRSIADCGLIILKGGHFVYAQKHREFCAILKSFLDLK